MHIKTVANEKFRIKLTDICNMCCPFCHSEGSIGAKDIDIDSTELKDSLQFLRTDFSQVHLTGGEPMLYKDLTKIIMLLKQYNYTISLTSNGLFSVDEMLPVLQELKYINLSVHSLNPEFIKVLIPNSKDQNKISQLLKQNILALKKILPLRINCVVMNTGENQDLSELLLFAREHNIELKFVPEFQCSFWLCTEILYS